MTEQCRAVDVDGQTVIVRGGELLTAGDIDAIRELTRAARRAHDKRKDTTQ